MMMTTSRPQLATTQPRAMAEIPQHMKWYPHGDARCGNARELKQLRRVAMHVLECLLRAGSLNGRQSSSR